MKVDFYKAHNGLPSIKVNGIPLHSSYDPLKEAERAVESAAYKFRPSWIFVVEPGLSYCADFFRKKFPDTKLCALRFLKLGVENDLKWDKVIYDSGKDILSEKIFNCMGDEGVASCFFWTWPASEKIFPDETKAAWEEIKKVVIKTRNILNPRSYFAKRWIRNSTRFCLFSHYNAYILKGGIPVIVCASGPSLKSSIEYLKMYRDFYFLIAVSSALAPLTNEGIIPDLCLSTDGGYWAKLHLEFALKKYNIPIALSPEAACYAETLDKHTVVPISYGDGVAEKLLSLCNYINVPAIRNGTVSGTAADLALNITTAEVFFCGLDLAPNPGFSHTQPNELEINGSCSDNRFCTQETRITPYTFNSPALDIYKAWFSETTLIIQINLEKCMM